MAATGSAIVTEVTAGGSVGDWEPLLAACRDKRFALADRPKIWVALSGGADSRALLEAMLRVGISTPICVSHIDHGVHRDSRQWAEHCAQLCQRLGVGLQIKRLTPPSDGRFAGGFEAWARSERYACWQQLLGVGEVLLCAHHADDQAETVALRLLQGRLPLPMPAHRELGPGTLLRPLLLLPRSTLHRALEGDGHRWLEDPSNEDTRFLRNQVRRLLPQLGACGNWCAALRRCGDLVQRQQDALKAALQSSRSGVATGAGGWLPASDAAAGGAGELGRMPLAAIPGAVALQGVLALIGSGPVSRGQASDALLRLRDQAEAGAASGAARGGVRIGGGRAGRHSAELRTSKARVQAGELSLWLDALEVVFWREPVFTPRTLAGCGQERVVLPHGTLSVDFSSETLESAAGVVEPQCVVRSLAPADRLLHNGRQRPVKELLRANGVPRWARGSYPVVAAGEVILAVPATESSSGTSPAERRLAENGWLRDGATWHTPIRLSWSANLPS